MIGKFVYTANAATDKADCWLCVSTFRGSYQGKMENLCVLERGKTKTILPKRCVFLTKEAALTVLSDS